MDEQVMWGLLLIAYILPFGLWQMLADSTLDIRGELYPGRGSEKRQRRFFNAVGLLWCVGLVFALAAWADGWDPLGVALVLSLAAAAVFIGRIANRRWNLLANQLVRYWTAGSAVWAFGVLGWFLVFGRVSELHDEEFLLLALTPSVIAAFGIVAWRWARRKS